MAFNSSFRSTLPSLAALVVGGSLTGCYTQLATRGYGAVEAPAYGAPPDSAAGDSALAGQPQDYRGAPPVIVNNYYEPGLAYRGYAHWEWDYPALTLGYYSSRYSHFSRPYWWDDPYYYRGRTHRHGHRHRDWDYRPAPGGGGSAAPPRLLSPEPDYRRPSKGRRSEPAPVSAPAPSPSPAPKQGEDGGSSSSGSSSGSSASPSSGSESQGSSTDRDGEYRSLKKGKRR